MSLTQDFTSFFVFSGDGKLISNTVSRLESKLLSGSLEIQDGFSYFCRLCVNKNAFQ